MSRKKSDNTTNKDAQGQRVPGQGGAWGTLKALMGVGAIVAQTHDAHAAHIRGHTDDQAPSIPEPSVLLNDTSSSAPPTADPLVYFSPSAAPSQKWMRPLATAANGVQIPTPMVPVLSTSPSMSSGDVASFALPEGFNTHSTPASVIVSGLVPAGVDKFNVFINVGNVKIQVPFNQLGSENMIFKIADGPEIVQKGIFIPEIKANEGAKLFLMEVVIDFTDSGVPNISFGAPNNVIVGRPKADQYSDEEEFYGSGGSVMRINQISGVNAETTNEQALVLLREQYETQGPKKGYTLPDAYAGDPEEDKYTDFPTFFEADADSFYNRPDVQFGPAVSVRLDVPEKGKKNSKDFTWEVATTWKADIDTPTVKPTTHKKTTDQPTKKQTDKPTVKPTTHKKTDQPTKKPTVKPGGPKHKGSGR